MYDQFDYNCTSTNNTDTTTTTFIMTPVVALVAWESIIGSPC